MLNIYKIFFLFFNEDFFRLIFVFYFCLMEQPTFFIYNASAGSGKTFTLVKSFLKIILQNPSPEGFKHLLAITFTNKAVSEMKERIIRMLVLFSQQNHPNDAMFSQIAQELHLPPAQLQQRSLELLQNILHNYAAFSVTTIDGFNQRLIRAFSFDLELNPTFEVFLSSDDLIQQAVENLLKKIDQNPKLSDFLLEFSKDRINEDKNWDIQAELVAIARLITVENNLPYLQELQSKTLEDFIALRRTIFQLLEAHLSRITENAQSFFSLLSQNALPLDSLRVHMKNFFEKIQKNPKDETLEKSFASKWFTEFEDTPLYTQAFAKKNPDLALVLDGLQPQIGALLMQIRESVLLRRFLRNILGNISPLAILSAIVGEIQLIKEQENILPIYEFNSIIQNAIANEPAPFIYERLGMRYKHYFIDEFQDTSTLQWQNMLPLVSDAMHSRNFSDQSGSLLLVGDAKQSIYRWRGGRAEQFMNLYAQKSNPFHLPATVLDLDTNYRSLHQIIAFNNDFFAYVANQSGLFSLPDYQQLYQNSGQKIPQGAQKTGFVQLNFINPEKNTDDEQEQALTKNEQYAQEIIRCVEDALQCGFQMQDICVITRRNAEGIMAAQALIDAGYSVISSESLLLNNIPQISFLIQLIYLSVDPENPEHKAKFLFLLAEIKQLTNLNAFLMESMQLSTQELLSQQGFSLQHFSEYSLYEGISYAIKVFGLAQGSDAYLSEFLNVVLQFQNSSKAGIFDFLTFWEEKKDKLSLSAPAGLDAISIMTVHKSKGLEFPVVIYAFANTKLTDTRDKIWLAVDKNIFHFNFLLSNHYTGLEMLFPEQIAQQTEQQLLDNMNVLYVALTRPKAHLYIISEFTKLPEQIKTFSDIFVQYLIHNNLWNEHQWVYDFGTRVQNTPKPLPESSYIPFQQGAGEASRIKIAVKEALLWESSAQNAIEKGNIIHQILANVQYAPDLLPALAFAVESGTISPEQRQLLLPQMKHLLQESLISPYFKEDFEVFNEMELLAQGGKYLRPDRIVRSKHNGECFLIDYKTGSHHPQYEKQMLEYANLIRSLGWNLKEAFLVFLDKNNEIIPVAV